MSETTVNFAVFLYGINGYSMLINGYSMLINGYSMLINGYSMLINGYSMLINGYSMLINGYSMLINIKTSKITRNFVTCVPHSSATMKDIYPEKDLCCQKIFSLNIHKNKVTY